MLKYISGLLFISFPFALFLYKVDPEHILTLEKWQHELSEGV